jgi:hypothetical protein
MHSRYDNNRQYCKDHIRTICEIKHTMNNKCVRNMLCLDCCYYTRLEHPNRIKSYYCSKCNLKGCPTCSSFATFNYNRPICIDTYGHDWLINQHMDLP